MLCRVRPIQVFQLSKMPFTFLFIARLQTHEFAVFHPQFFRQVRIPLTEQEVIFLAGQAAAVEAVAVAEVPPPGVPVVHEAGGAVRVAHLKAGGDGLGGQQQDLATDVEPGNAVTQHLLLLFFE